MRRFAFTDSSGILRRDQFFGVGLLIVSNTGDISDKLYKNSQPAVSLAVTRKNQAIESLVAKGREEEVIKMLRNNKRFEMKFDNVGNQQTLPYYESMVNIFLSSPNNRFSAMVVDKTHPAFNDGDMEDSWETYTKYIALLTTQEMRNLPDDELCLIVDEISKPQTKPLSLEDTIISKIRDEIIKDTTVDFDKVFGAVTIESHSSLLMQLCDVLLGAVMYDYKKGAGLISKKTERKKELFVQKVRSVLGISTLASEFTANTASYFNVSRCFKNW